MCLLPWNQMVTEAGAGMSKDGIMEFSKSHQETRTPEIWFFLMEAGTRREEYKIEWENWRRPASSKCVKGLGWNSEVRWCPGTILGTRTSQTKKQCCWGLPRTIHDEVLRWGRDGASPELVQMRWKRNSQYMSRHSQVMKFLSLLPIPCSVSLFLSCWLHETHQKNTQLIPFPADSCKRQEPTTTICYTFKTRSVWWI